MLQEISQRQVQRKKILTRCDLIRELENILSDFREKPQFAGLRSLSLGALCQTDNPYLNNITLGDLSTNAAEVLRDSNMVDKTEIAGLIESVFLLNVKSCYAQSMVHESFSRIEHNAKAVQEELSKILTNVSTYRGESSRVAPEDSNVARLRAEILALVRSSSFEKVKNSQIEEFWNKNASSCSIISKMTWQQLVETAPSAIFSLPNFGKSRFKNLLESIERARMGASIDPAAQENIQSDNPVLSSEKQLKNAIQELVAKSNQASGKLAEVFEESQSQALLTAYMCQKTIQRRVGQIFGVTESRISQLLNEACLKLTQNLSRLDPQLAEKLEFRLCSPACSEHTLLKVLGIDQLSEEALDLLRVLLISLDASNPTFRGKSVERHWTKRENKFEPIIKEVLVHLPLSTAKLSAKIEEVLVGSSAQEILEVLPPAAYYLRKRDCWYNDQEEALVEILKSAKKPLTAHQITALFETGPRQMRYLLQHSKKIVRIGKNNGRRYSIPATDQL